jgi:hypothetical protein
MASPVHESCDLAKHAVLASKAGQTLTGVLGMVRMWKGMIKSMDRTFIACDRQSTVSLPKAVIQLNVSLGQPQWKRSKQNRNHHHDAWTGLLSTGS